MKIVYFLFLLLFFSQAKANDKYNVGVFYYPGWKNNTISNVSKYPWQNIAKENIKPILGYYAEDSLNVMKQQIAWMDDFGIDFVVMDWYWDTKYKVLKKHSIDKLRDVSSNKYKYTVMWANHGNEPESLSDFDLMVAEISKYMADASYFRQNGQPVLYIFSARTLDKQAELLGGSGNELINRAKNIIFKKINIHPLIFIGDSAYYFSKIDKDYWSYSDGVFAYNYHGAANYLYEGGRSLSHNYKELSDGYANNWQWFLNKTDKQYHVPITSGWNKTPWGGSEDIKHDQSISTPALFRQHLEDAKKFVDNNPVKTNNTLLICCWNEFGEGSYIEPTEKYQFEYLQQIKAVFDEKE